MKASHAMLRVALMLTFCVPLFAADTTTTTTTTTVASTASSPGGPTGPTSSPVVTCTTADVYIGTNTGSIAISHDGGESWRKVPASVSGAVQDIVVRGKSIYVAADGGLFVSQDNGTIWNKPFSGSTPMKSLYTDASAGRTWASGQGLVLRSENDGGSWTACEHPFDSNTPITGIYATGDLVYAGGPGGLAISDDRATAWRIQGGVFQSANVVALGGFNNSIYASMQTSKVGISKNSGKTWRSQKVPPAGSAGINLAMNGLWVDGNKVYVATWGKGGSGSGLVISTDGGETWVAKTAADGLSSNNVSDIAAVGDYVFAVTDGGLAVSTDGGKTFSTVRTGLENEKLFCVYAQCSA